MKKMNLHKNAERSCSSGESPHDLCPEDSQETGCSSKALSQTVREIPSDTCIHVWFEAQVHEHPDAVAVVSSNNQTLSYRQLNERANQLAHYLRDQGVGPEVLVGICLERSLDLVVGLLGILKAGGAYVPLDPIYPQERMAFIVKDADIHVLVTQNSLEDVFVESGITKVCLDRDREEIEHQDNTDLGLLTHGENLAYVIYTSGSTGKPKGTLITHHNVVRLFQATESLFSFGAHDVWTLFHSFAFDFSVWELWGALLYGGTLVIVSYLDSRSPDALLALLAREKVTVLNQTPSAFQQLLRALETQHETPPHLSLRYIIFGGEALEFTSLRPWFERYGSQTQLVNMYGITETTVHVTYRPVAQEDTFQRTGSLIGQPMADLKLYILDEHLKPVQTGETGEICVSGAGLARGYLNRKALTSKKFIRHPFPTPGQERLYRSGDMGRLLSNGDIEYLGRLDDQVKIRGFRIELGEIEATLMGHHDIRQAVVLVSDDVAGDKRLVAYLVCSRRLTWDQLRRYLTPFLPGYMIPSSFVFVDAIPLTPNGKIDRSALSLLAQKSPIREEDYIPPETRIQRTLAEIWSEVLGYDRIGLHDNFFHIGGHSLSATKVVYLINDRFQVNLAVSSLFLCPTISTLTAVVEEHVGKDQSAHRIVPADILHEGPQPASYAQQRMWFLAEYDPDSPLYNIAFAFECKGRLDVLALEKSINDIIQRHGSLRTTFDVQKGTIVQKVHPYQYRKLAIDKFGKSPHIHEACLTEHASIKQVITTPFDLRHGPLLRMRLFHVEREHSVLVITMHHIISDGWSMDVFFAELSAAYNARLQNNDPDLTPLTIQYTDFALWQQTWLTSEVRNDELTYWLNQLASPLPIAGFPTDYARPGNQTFRGRQLALPLGRELTRALRTFSDAQGKTLFMTSLAAFKILLYRYSGQEDILVGSPIANRTQLGLESLIGFFVNTIILRTHLADDPTVRELLQRIEAVCLAGYEHQHLPFEALVEALKIERDPSRSPLFQTMFVFQNAHQLSIDLTGLDVQCHELSTDTSKFDLTLILQEQSEQLVAIAEYNTDLYKAETIERLLGHYQTLLESMVSHPDSCISALDLLPSIETKQLIETWNQTQREYPQKKCVHQLFEEQVRRTPDGVSVRYKDQQLTYRQLNEQANQLARYLRRQGVQSGAFVGVYMDRCMDMIVALLGILKAGGAYVPLDPAYPMERIRYMVEDAQLNIMVVQHSINDALRLENMYVIDMTADRDAIEREEISDPSCKQTSDDLAYVIYTSGSTGHPKGVEVPHRGIARLLFDVEYVDLSTPQTFLQLAPISFDASTFEIWGPLLHGHTCVLFPDRVPQLDKLAQVLADYHISCLWLTASLFNLVIDKQPSMLAGVRQLLTGGEALSVDHISRALEQLPDTQLINGYGPTESTTFTCCYRIPKSFDRHQGSVPIGQPIANTQVYLLDKQLQPVPMGAIGELYIGGDGLARGYLNRPELTRERFIENPIDPSRSSRLYKTGDLCRYRADGTIEFKGRTDFQVKLRGFRIELGEIENALLAHPDVIQSVVLVREDEPGNKRLVAYLVCSQEATPDQWRDYLRQSLPDYMIPAAFVLLDEMPLTPNGKINRGALPAPDQAALTSTRNYVPPETPMQRALADIFAEVLGVEKVGIQEDFFQLGGHSLLAIRVVYEIQRMLQLDIPLARLFQCPTVAQLSEVVESALSASGPSHLLPAVERVRRGQTTPQSFAQQRLWFLSEWESAQPFYHVPLRLHLQGKLDNDALEHALNAIIARHEILRTTFDKIDGKPVQIVHDHSYQPLKVQHFESQDDISPEHLQSLLRDAAQEPFDLRVGPLIRFTLYQVSEENHILLLVLHHIICDEWSVDILLKELEEFYAAEKEQRSVNLPPLTVQYADYSDWQHQLLRGPLGEIQLSYWLQQLQSPLTVLELPTDFIRPARQTYNGSHARKVLDSRLTEGLGQLSRRYGKTPFMTLLTVFQILLYRYTGQEDIVVGSPMANRTRQELEPLIGFFVNTLVLRTDLSGDLAVHELLDRVERVCLEAYQHQDLPFEQLVERLQTTRDLSRTPLFQVMFVLANAEGHIIHLPGLEVSGQFVETETAKFDLTLFVEEQNDRYVVTAEYNTDLYKAETIERLLGHYQILLESMVSQPDSRISRLNLLPTNEAKQLIETWNQTQRDYPRDKCIHQLFEEQVQKTPDAIAVLFEDQQLTYRQLNEQANQLARYLKRQGVTPGNFVAICMERSLKMVIGLLAILKAEGAYIPLDPNYPSDRLAFMLEDSGADIILVSCQTQAMIEAMNRATPLNVEKSWPTIGEESRANVPCRQDSSMLAYVIYTSGSTGKPKGVQIFHQALVNFIHSMQDAPGITDNDVLLSVTTISFDIFNLELHLPLCVGAQLVLATQGQVVDGQRLSGAMTSFGVTLMQATPVTWQLLLSSGWRGKHDLKILCGGEALSTQLANDLLDRCESLWNLYGPTETTIWSTVHRVERAHLKKETGGLVSIGKPIANTQVYLLDRNLSMVPIGVPGELYLGGDGLARGYLNRPELTRERFIDNPIDPSRSSRLYKTGDLCRYRADGTIEFIGRTDFQIKLRGHRIELGEIENALLTHPDVTQSVVLVHEDDSGHKRLVAYLVCSHEVTSDQWRAYLRQTLPDYMIPAVFVLLDEMPLTPNGKINRHALPAPQAVQPSETQLVPPETPTQKILASLFADVLKIHEVGLYDDFFALGGHSLLAVKLLDGIQKKLSKTFPLATLFNAANVKDLADLIENEQTEVTHQSLVLIRPGGAKEPIFLLPGAGGHSMAFASLARHLIPERSIIGLELQGLDGKAKPHETIEEMASYFIHLIRSAQKQGPYYLAGYSIGANIAFEMASQLTEDGDTVGMLILIAGVAPGHVRWSRYKWLNYTFRLIDFLTLPTKEKMRYIPFKIADFKKKINRRRENRKVHQGEKMSEANLTTHIKRVEQAALKALARYQPLHKYRGNVLLFRDTRIDSPLYRHMIRSNAGWDQYISGSIERHEIPSGHIEILSGDYAPILAAKINGYLEQNSRQGRSETPRVVNAIQGQHPKPTALTDWSVADDNLVLSPQELHVFLVDLQNSMSQINRYESLLSSDELDRAKAFVRAEDRGYFIIRHGILRELISRYTKIDPIQIRLCYDSDGKPYLSEEQNLLSLHFSMSSRQGLALYGFSRDSVLGIDLESVEPIDNLLDLASAHFHVDEYQCLAQLPESLRRQAFYRCWTGKEAYIKARGIIALDRFSIAFQPEPTLHLLTDETTTCPAGRWSMLSIDLGSDWCAAVVVQTSDVLVRYWRIP